jgi:hypothetical protein
MIGEFNSASGELLTFSSSYIESAAVLIARHGFEVKKTAWDAPEWDSSFKNENPTSQTTKGKHNSYSSIGVSPIRHSALPSDLVKNLNLAPLKRTGRTPKWVESETTRFTILFGQNPTDPGSCRICDSPCWGSDTLFYCSQCCAAALNGIWQDDGLEGPQTQRTLWALKRLGQIEFSGPPAVKQLERINSTSPDVIDELMLCRFAIPRRGVAETNTKTWRGWNEWLRRAGLLDQPMKTARGTQSYAADGHFCRSMLERHIDDFFIQWGIQHDVEPHYPYDEELNTTGLRADWLLANGVFVEAWGLAGTEAYDQKMQIKQHLAEKNGIRIVGVTVGDLARLAELFQEWIHPKIS